MDTYTKKIQNLNLKFPHNISPLAKKFIMKLINVNPLERYTANEALCHPWITRIPDKIPLSYNEQLLYDDSKIRLINVIITISLGTSKLLLFSNNIKKKYHSNVPRKNYKSF